MVENKAIAVSVASATGAYVALDHNYITVALAGFIIGLLSWFYALTHANPEWSKKQGISELLRHTLLSSVTMPMVIAGLNYYVKTKYKVDIPEISIALATFTSFTIASLMPTITEALKKVIERVLK